MEVQEVWNKDWSLADILPVLPNVDIESSSTDTLDEPILSSIIAPVSLTPESADKLYDEILQYVEATGEPLIKID